MNSCAVLFESSRRNLVKAKKHCKILCIYKYEDMSLSHSQSCTFSGGLMYILQMLDEETDHFFKQNCDYVQLNCSLTFEQDSASGLSPFIFTVKSRHFIFKV